MKCSLLIAMLVFALPVQASAQSDTPSQASAISMAPSAEVLALSLKALPAGSRLIVNTMRPVGEFVEIVAMSAVTGVSITLHVSAETVKTTGLLVGGTLLVATVSTGYLLWAGSEALAYIPDASSRTHIHHRKLS
jgi:hypothetical protein